MSFTDIFIRRPILALVVSLLILLMGAAAVFSLPVRQYPYLENATVTVTTSFPGATQEVMQGFVTTPISQSIATASGIEYLSSTTTQGKSEIKARLVLNADADRAMTEIRPRCSRSSTNCRPASPIRSSASPPRAARPCSTWPSSATR